MAEGTLTKAWRSLKCNLWCSVGTENQDAEDEYHRTAQASWVQRMFTSLFSDSALFNTREGRAGKVDGRHRIMVPWILPGVSSPISPHHQVHNFMLGLNLNTNVPFSPASGVTHHGPSLEEEVDAVTGMMDAMFLVFLLFYGQIHSFMCVSNSNKRLGVVLYSDILLMERPVILHCRQECLPFVNRFVPAVLTAIRGFLS